MCVRVCVCVCVCVCTKLLIRECLFYYYLSKDKYHVMIYEGSDNISFTHFFSINKQTNQNKTKILDT